MGLRVVGEDWIPPLKHLWLVIKETGVGKEDPFITYSLIYAETHKDFIMLLPSIMTECDTFFDDLGPDDGVVYRKMGSKEFNKPSIPIEDDNEKIILMSIKEFCEDAFKVIPRRPCEVVTWHYYK